MELNVGRENIFEYITSAWECGWIQVLFWGMGPYSRSPGNLVNRHPIVPWLPNKRFAWPQSCEGFVNMSHGPGLVLMESNRVNK
jgi:hypothetical protein